MKKKSMYRYETTGVVGNIGGEVLPRDDKEYLVFSLIVKTELRWMHGVLYIHLDDANAISNVKKVVRAVRMHSPVTVKFERHVPWNPATQDPDGFAYDVTVPAARRQSKAKAGARRRRVG